ncbi:hypothetical protein [Micromonospora sp. RTP1Z1]|uniref:hypothetical protein n=1 Tax=Micromonospora sp. RTP1Z1 TaxID=2994043 RepID=UPI0029C8ED30|nr:hypothetical protein [Micromonospora sp. RTP1Z1]
MNAVNVVEKFNADGFLERSWALPPEVVVPLRAHVNMTEEGWIMYEWPVTAEIASIVQPWVDEPIDVASDAWNIGSEQAPD